MSHVISAKNIKVSATKSLANRFEIVSWVNKLLEINLSKVEELATGEIYCKLFYLLFQNSIKPSKIKPAATEACRQKFSIGGKPEFRPRKRIF